MDQSFHKFLREQRRLNETVVTTFINEKIDCYAVHGMTDDQLMKYVPKIGDRIAIRQYCRTEVAALEGTTTTISKATESLMKKIKERRASKRSHEDERSEKLSGNSNALKRERVFQMGLFEEVGAKNIQVKERRGGGTRHLKALKTTTMAQLMDIGKELFFPNGKSKIGNVNDFEFCIRDFTEDELAPLTTLGEQYEKRKVKMLRLYLSCKKIDAEEKLNDATSPGESQNAVPLTRKLPCAAAASYGAASTTATTCGSDFTTGTPRTKASTCEPSNTVTLLSTETDIFEEDDLISLDDEIVIGYGFLEDNTVDLDDTLPMDLHPEESSFTVQEPCEPFKTTKLRLHRGNVFKDLNAAFKSGCVSVDDSILEIEMVLPNGVTEKGEDNGGVLRDALSEYWETFFMKCTAGNILKVPMTRHDMKDEWENVAKVMVLGYNIVKYFPIVLAKPFLSYCLGLEIMEDELFAAFLEMVPTDEKEIAEEAMKDFNNVREREEWLDFLEVHDVKVLITEANVRKTLVEVAHKEIVQDPAYIAECWSSALKRLKLPPGGLDEVLASLTPTPRKVVAMLQHETLNKREDQTLDFLKKFIRNCSEVRLRKFLRFCTGADLLVAKDIHVRFIEPESTFTRRPQSHTCGCVLEVPNNYASYPELAEEFTNVLDANMWVMDII